jgi:hypothetical protein
VQIRTIDSKGGVVLVVQYYSDKGANRHDRSKNIKMRLTISTLSNDNFIFKLNNHIHTTTIIPNDNAYTQTTTW